MGWFTDDRTPVHRILDNCWRDARVESKLTDVYFAIDKTGNPTLPKEPDAVAWCMMGLIWKHEDEEPANPMKRKGKGKLNAFDMKVWSPNTQTAITILSEEVSILSSGKVTLTNANDFWIKSDMKDRIPQAFFRAAKVAKELGI
jgi:hypothetical protein